MTNHPNRSRGPYTAELGGSSWKQGPVAQFPTVTAARAWAEEYGDTADYCTITDKNERIIASHRQTNGIWFKASI